MYILFILNFSNVFGQRNSVSKGESFRSAAFWVFVMPGGWIWEIDVRVFSVYTYLNLVIRDFSYEGYSEREEYWIEKRGSKFINQVNNKCLIFLPWILGWLYVLSPLYHYSARWVPLPYFAGEDT